MSEPSLSAARSRALKQWSKIKEMRDSLEENRRRREVLNREKTDDLVVAMQIDNEITTLMRRGYEEVQHLDVIEEDLALWLGGRALLVGTHCVVVEHDDGLTEIEVV